MTQELLGDIIGSLLFIIIYALNFYIVWKEHNWVPMLGTCLNVYSVRFSYRSEAYGLHLVYRYKKKRYYGNAMLGVTLPFYEYKGKKFRICIDPKNPTSVCRSWHKYLWRITLAIQTGFYLALLVAIIRKLVIK